MFDIKNIKNKGLAIAVTSAIAMSVFTPFVQRAVNADVIDALLNDKGVGVELNYEFDPGKTTGVEGFVNRLYSVCLGRGADSQGFNEWCDLLTQGKISGASAAKGFIFSKEFTDKELSNEDYVSVLYRVFFDRGADAVGLEGWVKALNDGYSREQVMYGFVDSIEWANVCVSYGIHSGGLGVPTIGVEVDGAKTFVINLYTECLGRYPDPTGFREWYDKLLSQEITGKQAAYGFFFSIEFNELVKKSTTDEVISIFYKVFLDRGPDAQGLYAWEDIYYWGGTPSLFNGFADSLEFDLKCQKCSILTGDHLDVPQVTLETSFMNFARYETYGMNVLDNATGLNSHNTYNLYNTQGSSTKTTKCTISSKDLDAIKRFADANFQPHWTNGQKAVYTMWWIHNKVTYASSSSQWGAISGMGYAQAIFDKRLGQCAQYNGAMCEMLCYLGYDANMIQGYRGSSSSSQSQHFWCEVTIDGNIYVVEAGNIKDGSWHYFVVPYSSTRKFIKNGVVQG